MPELEKVSIIEVRARFLNPRPELDLPNALTFIGSAGIILELINRDFNPIATVWLVAATTYGALGSELLGKIRENNTQRVISEFNPSESLAGTLEIIS